MGTIVPKISSSLSKMWTKVLNLEKTLFPALKEELRLKELSQKEQKFINTLDFAEIEKNITVVSITNTPILCGWRYKNDIPSESKFSRVFKELSKMKIAQKTHKQLLER